MTNGDILQQAVTSGHERALIKAIILSYTGNDIIFKVWGPVNKV